MSDGRESVRQLDAARWRVALGLTAVMVVLYFGFVLLVAYGRPLLAVEAQVAHHRNPQGRLLPRLAVRLGGSDLPANFLQSDKLDLCRQPCRDQSSTPCPRFTPGGSPCLESCPSS